MEGIHRFDPGHECDTSWKRPDSGKNNIMVGLFQFQDIKPKLVAETLINKFNGNARSLKNYYYLLSNGQVDFEFGSAGIKNEWMMMPKKYSEYGDDYESLFNDAYNLMIKKGYKLDEFDSDENGTPDLIIFVWAGNSWTVGGPVPGDFMMPGDEGNIISLGEDMTKQDGFSLITLLHEFFHGYFNLWDLYDYNRVITDVVGGWDLMGEGVWSGYCGLSAFHRWKAGWVEMETITEPGVYEINDLNTDNPHRAYKIPIPGSDKEWILLENRQRHGGDGYFQGCPNNGLVAYHIDDSREYRHLFNTQSKNNPNPGVRVLDMGGSANDLENAHMGKNLGRSNLTGTTTPNTLPYRPTPGSKTISITEISEVGLKMTFKLSYVESQLPIVSVAEILDLGKIEKGKSATVKLNFRNAGKGKLKLSLKPLDSWITIDRNSFIGVDEDINVTVDTSKLDYGIYNGKISYGGESMDKIGYVKVTLKVIPKFGDINGDGAVDMLDFALLMASFGADANDPRYNENADFNEDFVVDINDFFIMARNFDKIKE